MTAHDPDLLRRIELERADAKCEAYRDVLTEIDALGGNEMYQRAWKKLEGRVYRLLRLAGKAQA